LNDLKRHVHTLSVSQSGVAGADQRGRGAQRETYSEQEEEEEEFFNHYKNDLKRHAHTLSGVAGADL